MREDSRQATSGRGSSRSASESGAGCALDLERLLETRVQDEEGQHQELRRTLRGDDDEFVTCPVLVWVRYLGCPVCRNQVAELKKIEDDLYENYQAYLVLVTNSPHESVRPFQEQWGTRHSRILVDREGATYDAAGLRRSLRTLFNPSSVKGVLSAMRRGFSHGSFEGDLRQLGGLAVLSSGAERVLYHYACTYVGDFIPLDALKRASLLGYGGGGEAGQPGGAAGALLMSPS